MRNVDEDELEGKCQLVIDFERDLWSTEEAAFGHDIYQDGLIRIFLRVVVNMEREADVGSGLRVDVDVIKIATTDRGTRCLTSRCRIVSHCLDVVESNMLDVWIDHLDVDCGIYGPRGSVGGEHCGAGPEVIDGRHLEHGSKNANGNGQADDDD